MREARAPAAVPCRVCQRPVDFTEPGEIRWVSGENPEAIHQGCKVIEELRGLEKFAAFIRRGYCDCDSCCEARRRHAR